jgi:cephalosporin hydroxylase
MLMQKIKREMSTLRDIVYYRLYFKPEAEKGIVDQFHKLYYDASRLGKTFAQTRWMDVPVRKNPFDLWNYQELIYSLKPDLIIETGTLLGGSAFYFASLCELFGKGAVVTIDIDDAETTLSKERAIPTRVRPDHPRLTYIRGSSTDPAIVNRVKGMIPAGGQVLVILDSDHRKPHVLDELRTYGPLVPKGSYMIVEDGNINGHPVEPGYGPGPMEAMDDFFKENKDFVIDEGMEKHLMTFNPKGYLRKVR